ncbi:hypothetical protein [Halomonas sp. BC1]|uniref:hypothetical protein n=1 Tax=Halomonas sp. BC1 TaxID=1670448 RepID=UPI00111B8F66|nr:hypothetical protein [Halomonas sp. BC1]
MLKVVSSDLVVKPKVDISIAGNYELRFNDVTVSEMNINSGDDLVFIVKGGVSKIPDGVVFSVNYISGKFDICVDSCVFRESLCKHKTLKEFSHDLSKGLILNKKGQLQFKDWSTSKVNSHLEAYTLISGFLEDFLGYELFVTHGTALGIYRDNRIIPGDDDFDCCYFSELQTGADVAAERDMILHEASKLFDLVRACPSGHIRITVNKATIDLMPAWFKANKEINISGFTSMQYFSDLVFPAHLIEFEGTKIKLFNRVERFLEYQYGMNWKTPDPGYRSILSEREKQNRYILKPSQDIINKFGFLSHRTNKLV